MPFLDDHYRCFLQNVREGDTLEVHYERIELIRDDGEEHLGVIDVEGIDMFERNIGSIAWDIVATQKTAMTFERFVVPCLEHFLRLTVVLESVVTDSDVEALAKLDTHWFRSFRYRVRKLPGAQSS